MEPHEKGIKSARAGVAKADELGLPKENPPAGVVHDFDKQLVRLEKIILGEVEVRKKETKAREEEAKQTAELREAVVTWSRRTYYVVCGFILLVIVLFAVGAFAYDRISKIAKENRRLVNASAATQVIAARRARGVIRESCESQNRDRRKLRIIIMRSEQTIPALVREGTITQAQANRALEASRQARRDLHDEDCSSRAARIPIPEVSVP